MEAIPAKLTEKLLYEMDLLIKEGWYSSRSELIRDAIREMIRKMKVEKLEASIKEDVKWALYGKN